jgi:3-methyladenine DNA glycosylase AlkD
MPPRRKTASEKASASSAKPSIEGDVEKALAWLRDHATTHTLEGMKRYGIPSDNALGVAVSDIKALGKLLGRRHELAEALWETGIYEARMLTSFVDEPERVTAAQMDRWCRDFDSWAIVDTLCFHLFDRTQHAWGKVEAWSGKRDEFGKRAAFALLACLALHDRHADDDSFLDGLRLVELAATDDRNFVKKGVNWALRAVGERNAALNAAAVNVARRLAESPNASARWIGKDALRQLASPAVQKRLASPRRTGAKRPAKAD